MKESSDARLNTFKSYPKPLQKRDVIQMLGDRTNEDNPVFRSFTPEDPISTIAVGLSLIIMQI